MKTALADDRQIFDNFRGHDALLRLRVHADEPLGHPAWWLAFRWGDNARALATGIEACYEIWNDPRLRRFPYAKAVHAEVRRRPKDSRPFTFRAGGSLHLCVPLFAGGRRVGAFGLSEIRQGASPEILSLVVSQVQTILETAARKEELDRLSASIRPRAIALSTVHTVHRIVNSTLNLDELISRLAHLTAQVLRAGRCAIYLVDAAKKPKALVAKALVGYPKSSHSHDRIRIGHGLEGRIAKTADTVLRRKLIAIPLIDEDIIGVITVGDKKSEEGFTYFDREILTTLAEEAVIAIKNAQLYEEQKKVTLGTIQSLAVILGTRVSRAAPEALLRVALEIAGELRLGEEETQALHYAVLLKDTARIGIPEEILKKPAKLTGEEYALLREHPVKGAKIVQSFDSLKSVVPIILYSREKFDGTGYPKGLKGERIPCGARILAVINAFEAIIMGRPYRNSASIREALDEIGRNKGTQFDPHIADVFIRIVEREDPRRFIRS